MAKLLNRIGRTLAFALVLWVVCGCEDKNKNPGDTSTNTVVTNRSFVPEAPTSNPRKMASNYFVAHFGTNYPLTFTNFAKSNFYELFTNWLQTNSFPSFTNMTGSWTNIVPAQTNLLGDYTNFLDLYFKTNRYWPPYRDDND